MKKLLILPLLLGVLILGGCTKVNNGGQSFGEVQTITNSVATTTTALPVMVLNYNPARKYAKIMNDSATAIYLNLVNFASASAASTTVVVNKGIRLNATGGEYIIGSDNLWVGQVWASSTAAALNIVYSEMQ